MPSKLPEDGASDAADPPPTSFDRQTAFVKSFFAVPPPIKALFDRVPLLTYPPTELPQRSPKPARIPTLYVFSTERDAAKGRPSFNPSCLKWQTFLHIAGIDHRLVSSNNHASPSGALPFLLPAHDARPIPSSKLRKYASDHGTEVPEPESIRYEAYQSLIDHRIRHAWLYTLYLSPANFTAITHPLYILPTSRSPLVRASIARSLRAAASAELLKHRAVIDPGDLYSEADKAFEALSLLLGEDEWFFGSESPTLFDASVFAYTQLLLDERLVWAEGKLSAVVRRRGNLVRHRGRVVGRYYAE